jgi:mono/diheme cytochrome c family protein
MRKILKWTGIILLIIIAGLYITIEARQNLHFDAPYPAITASKDSAVIARGKQLVFGPAHCANCHVPASGQEAVLRGETVPLSGGLRFDLPIGSLYTRNLTPDKTGIGMMTDAEIARVLRYGVNAKGNAVFDFMPFHNTSDDDLTAIISYLRSQPAVQNRAPVHNFNLLGKAVRAFLIKPVGPAGPVLRSIQPDSTVEYGKYLANSVANCRGCHTNRDLMTGEFIGPEFAGGLKFDIKTDSGNYSLTTPNLTPHSTGRIFGWSQEQFIARFKTGAVIKETHMPWGPFSRMSEEELKAIYKYLQTVKPVSNVVKAGLVKEP